MLSIVENLNLFDYFIIIIFSISMFFSFIKGFTQSLLSLLTWIGAVIITIIFEGSLTNFIYSYINQITFLEDTQLANIISRVLSIPFIFLLSLIILRKIKSFISNDFQKSSLGNFWDKIFGLLYGFIFALIIISILLVLLKNLFDGFESSGFIKNSYSYPFINEFTNNYIIKYTPLILENSEEIIEENLE